MTSILHLAYARDWAAAQSSPAGYQVSTRGAGLAETGFIHGSTAAQLPAVAELVYTGDPEDLVLLVIDLEALAAAGIEVRWEDGGSGQRYPHIYGPLRPAQVTAVLPAEFDGARFRMPDLAGRGVLVDPPQQLG